METWLAIKYTISGKLGAACITAAPFLLAFEMSNHVDAIISAIPPTVAIILGVIKLRQGQSELHVTIDGRMQELLKVTDKIARAEGKEEGSDALLQITKEMAHAQGKEEERSQERDRQAPPQHT